MLKSLKTYTIPIISLVLAIGIAFWRINYLERTNISLSIEIGSTAALQNGEGISLQNPVIWHENEPYVPINEVVSRLGGSIDKKTFTIQQNTVTVVGLLQDNVVYTPITYLQEKYMMAAKWDKERRREQRYPVHQHVREKQHIEIHDHSRRPLSFGTSILPRQAGQVMPKTGSAKKQKKLPETASPVKR